MTSNYMNDIRIMRLQGVTYKDIAVKIDIPLNTVKSFCHRNKIVIPLCKNSGTALIQTPKRRAKEFCDDRCRARWWRKNSGQMNKKAYYSFVCAACDKPFESYGNKNRKYCSRKCYFKGRYSPP